MADISHLPIQENVVYFSLVTEGYARNIVVWHLHASLQNRGGCAGIKKKLRTRNGDRPLVWHSGSGIQGVYVRVSPMLAQGITEARHPQMVAESRGGGVLLDFAPVVLISQAPNILLPSPSTNGRPRWSKPYQKPQRPCSSAATPANGLPPKALTWSPYPLHSSPTRCAMRPRSMATSSRLGIKAS